MTTEKELKKIQDYYNNIFTDINTLFDNIEKVDSSRDQMITTGNYTKAYIDEIIEKEITEKVTPTNSTLLDKIEVSLSAVYDSLFEILNATDILTDTRISSAVNVIALLDKTGIDTAENIYNQFVGCFPVINILASVSKDNDIKLYFEKRSLNKEDVVSIKDLLDSTLLAVKLDNLHGDLVSVFTRLVEFVKMLKKYGFLFGVEINTADFTVIDSSIEKAQLEAVKKAMNCFHAIV